MNLDFPVVVASHGSFGLNFNPFETNIINLAIVIAGLIYFLRGFLGGILERRKATITRANWLERKWVKMTGDLEFMELLEFSFSGEEL
jgi:hypothetical protein